MKNEALIEEKFINPTKKARPAARAPAPAPPNERASLPPHSALAGAGLPQAHHDAWGDEHRAPLRPRPARVPELPGAHFAVHRALFPRARVAPRQPLVWPLTRARAEIPVCTRTAVPARRRDWRDKATTTIASFTGRSRSGRVRSSAAPPTRPWGPCSSPSASRRAMSRQTGCRACLRLRVGLCACFCVRRTSCFKGETPRARGGADSPSGGGRSSTSRIRSSRTAVRALYPASTSAESRRAALLRWGHLGHCCSTEEYQRFDRAGRGVLSMANSGKNSNKSQFFILYKSAHHLDYKHTVFGQARMPCDLRS